MDYLRGNSNVLDVTESCVYFSATYKAAFYKELLSGKKAQDIFAESGINTEILGVNRVNGFRSSVLREAKAGKGFRDISTYTEFSGNYATSPEVRIKYLEQELEYKRQEIEFLKNSIFAPRGARTMNPPANAKYAIIQEMMARENNLLNVSWLCRTAGYLDPATTAICRTKKNVHSARRRI